MKGVTIQKIDPVYADARGSITDLLNEKISHVGLIVSEKDSVRGNHYHNLSVQYNYLLSGKLEISLATPESAGEIEKIVLNPGELITIQNKIIHKVRALEKSVFIDMISESRAGTGYEDDVVRVTLKD